MFSPGSSYIKYIIYKRMKVKYGESGEQTIDTSELLKRLYKESGKDEYNDFE